MYIIYGKEDCTYCEAAKNLLDSKGIEYEYKQVGRDISKEHLVAACQEYGVIPRTVPQIFKVDYEKTEYVGGFTELKASL